MKVEVLGLKELRRKIKASMKIAMNKTLRDKNLRLKIGALIAQDIRDNYRKDAGEVTKAFREYLEQFNKTHPDYKRPIINITFTGELLNDLATNVKADTTQLLFVVAHSNKKHKVYDSGGLFKQKTVNVTIKSGKKKGQQRKEKVRPTNKQISEWIIEKGHDYLNVTKDAEIKIVKLINEALISEFEKVQS